MNVNIAFLVSTNFVYISVNTRKQNASTAVNKGDNPKNKSEKNIWDIYLEYDGWVRLTV